MKLLLSGNEAAARGAWEAGATFGSAYPGTPSTECMEAFAEYDDVYAEWAINEKVAYESAIGASVAGARVLTTMKHVGVNVAADPMFTSAYTGVNGGFVIFAADDPGMHSSQNCQDSRFYALASHIPCLEPSDSNEAYAYTKTAYALSERFDVPLMVRSSVRVSHTKCPVEVGDKVDYVAKTYQKDSMKWVMMPAGAKFRRARQIERITLLESFAEETELNLLESFGKSDANDIREYGFVCSGPVYQYIKDAIEEADLSANVLKLGMVYPLCKNKLQKIRKQSAKLFVIDEGSEYLSQMISSLGIAIDDTPKDIKAIGELSKRDIKYALDLPLDEGIQTPKDIIARPPALCAGCPHRLVYKELSRLHAIVTGDIGCYTLGSLPPLSCMDTCICMGASVSMMHGFNASGIKYDRPIVSVIGDSTFAHSGVSSLISMVYNGGSGTVCVLDNRTTAMTGHQGNPFNGKTLQNKTSRELDIEGLCKAIGVKHVLTVDPYDMNAVRNALKEETSFEGVSVIVFKRPCVLLEKIKSKPYFVGDCKGCGICLTLGCPAISKTEQGLASISADQCIGCGQCCQYCSFKAINRL
ncbi:MAG: indolepyruvate ferredoxin oxidoreductase subunit alpha [Eggerthellaceae bacterium]|nr:indolepyruvate ferredoxin oxidoreductase subunit alpha [Eggerthellaceae bacterium]